MQRKLMFRGKTGRIEKLLTPGLNLKRWLSLSLASTLSLILFIELVVIYHGYLRYLFGLLALASALGIAYGYYMLFKNLSGDLWRRIDELYLRSQRRRASKVVVIGGGTGLASILEGLKELTPNLTAITTVTDDGGSTGKLIREIERLLPVGDIRNCIAALSDERTKLKELLNFRFGDVESLKGHALGNLILVALYLLNDGNFPLALRDAFEIFKTRGVVFPSSYQRGTLVAKLSNGEILRGETRITSEVKDKGVSISELWIEPEIEASKEAVKAITEADIIVIGPGSLYTSIISNLLISGIAEAIRASKAKKILMMNLVTQPGETTNMTASQHLSELIRYLGAKPDVVIANSRELPAEVAARYAEENSVQLSVEELREVVNELGVELIEADLLDEEALSKGLARHSAEKLIPIFRRVISLEKAKTSILPVDNS